ncbi:AraC family transcriptional regulator [Sinimarinibacterium sp. NLF-5-8]|uniref:AraC family transcriptional regulator n=1 Tax=Sinimarinibacterium sp. NLF-5-8 TaxID=2698684 RepID=UPI00137C0854|nr:AraC family transcriptional regulator [Sinimarinibacterium sp. NLF-5-8]QHS10599.1 AraC family transcriptional regulator [Sinimarinibacterium sp. NLF-5-8]
MSISIHHSIPGGLIASLYARGLLDYLRGRGIDPCALYAESRVRQLEAASGQDQIPLAEWVAMFDRAIAHTGEADLPLKAGASLHVRHLGVLGHVLMNCATLGEVAQQLIRYIRLLGQIGEPEVVDVGDQTHLIWHWPHTIEASPSVAQFMLGARAMFMRWLADRSDLIYDAHLHFPRPADTSAYARIFGGALHFDQPASKMVFARSYQQLPVASADEDLRQQVEARAQSLLQHLSGEPMLITQLKQVLARNLANGRVSLESAAQALQTSPRTLQRRLNELERPFQCVLGEVRQQVAENLLREPHISLTQIAFLLGYTEQSTFHNAFRRWTGLSPGHYRRQHGRAQGH